MKKKYQLIITYISEDKIKLQETYKGNLKSLQKLIPIYLEKEYIDGLVFKFKELKWDQV